MYYIFGRFIRNFGQENFVRIYLNVINMISDYLPKLQESNIFQLKNDNTDIGLTYFDLLNEKKIFLVLDSRYHILSDDYEKALKDIKIADTVTLTGDFESSN